MSTVFFKERVGFFSSCFGHMYMDDAIYATDIYKYMNTQIYRGVQKPESLRYYV